MDVQPQIVVGIFDLSGWHVLIILFVALLLFGHKLPDVMRNLGGSMREFKKGMNSDDQADAGQKPAAIPPPPATQPSAPAATAAPASPKPPQEH